MEVRQYQNDANLKGKDVKAGMVIRAYNCTGFWQGERVMLPANWTMPGKIYREGGSLWLERVGDKESIELTEEVLKTWKFRKERTR